MLIYFIDPFILLTCIIFCIIHFFVRNKRTYKIAGYSICGIIIAGCLLYVLYNQEMKKNCYFSETIRYLIEMYGIFNM